MSISAIGNTFNNHPIGTLSYQIQNSQFRQLGKDLTAGNLSAARSDFAMLRQAFAEIPSSTSSSTTNPVAQAFQQLSNDLKAGNLTAAQQDYSTVQNDLTGLNGARRFHFQHYHGTGGGNTQSTLMQDLNQLGQDLSVSIFSGNLSAAQQAYANPWQAFAPGTPTSHLGSGLQASTVEPVSGTDISFMA